MTAASGSVVSLWRYPVKSMMGEQLQCAHIGRSGVAGDRAFALIDRVTGKVASAKNPAKWGSLMQCHAQLAASRGDTGAWVAIMTLPDGRSVRSDQEDVDLVLSEFVGRDVILSSVAPACPNLEEYAPDLEELPERDVTTDAEMPQGAFVDAGAVHVLTTGTLKRFREIYPEGEPDVRRFRPNVVVEPANVSDGFVENEWPGRTLRIGEQVRLKATEPCQRCVMTTLPQGDLRRDPGILRLTARYNQLNAGVYASVIEGGVVRQADDVVVN